MIIDGDWHIFVCLFCIISTTLDKNAANICSVETETEFKNYIPPFLRLFFKLLSELPEELINELVSTGFFICHRGYAKATEWMWWKDEAWSNVWHRSRNLSHSVVLSTEEIVWHLFLFWQSIMQSIFLTN